MKGIEYKCNNCGFYHSFFAADNYPRNGKVYCSKCNQEVQIKIHKIAESFSSVAYIDNDKNMDNLEVNTESVQTTLNYEELQIILDSLKERKERISRNEIAIENKEQDYWKTVRIYQKLEYLNNQNFVHTN